MIRICTDEASIRSGQLHRLSENLGEFLKGYIRKKMGEDGVGTGYIRGGDSRGLAQACDIAMDLRNVVQRC